MKTSTRKVLDKSFDALSRATLAMLVLAAIAFILPILVNGIGAIIFKASVEHDKFRRDNLDATLSESALARIEESDLARAKIYTLIDEFESKSSSDKLGEPVAKARQRTLKKLDSHSGEMRSIAELPPAERIEKAQSISKNLWKEYSAILETAANYSIKNGSCFAFGEFLKLEDEILKSQIKEAVDELCKGLSVSKKSSLRRGLIFEAALSIEKTKEKIDAQNSAYFSFKRGLSELLGPRTEAEKSAAKLMRQKYGQTRNDVALKVFEESVATLTVKEKSADGSEQIKKIKTKEFFKGSIPAKISSMIKSDFDKIMGIHLAFYPGFLTDNPIDANIFGGIFPMVAGTFYLTILSMLIAAPLGIIAAIYFSEYVGNGRIISLLRMCVGTLAGVPSIVFGLFGLAFLINSMKISDGKSVIAGAITLALLILPTIIRSSEEALKAVPHSYREAALALGAGKWRAICQVVLPAAIPSVLTGVIISMGRAAGETAPIIFTAATSTGLALGIGEIFSQPTPALPWNIYNICSEHELAERVQHVQYGMVFTLMAIVLTLNILAIWARAKLQSKLK